MANRWLLSVALLLVGITAAQADEVDRCRKAEGKLMQRVYSVADLVIPIEGCPQPANKKVAPTTTEEQLIALIKNTVSPKSWTEAGGNGTIDYFPLTMALVINQTTAIQEEVAALLEALRRMQDVQIMLEVRLISVGEGVWERLGLELEKKKVEPKAGTPVTVSHLNDKQVFMLMEALQQDRRTCIMQAPKMTLLNGQKATVDVTETPVFVTGVDIITNGGSMAFVPRCDPVGFQMKVQAVATADQRAVKLHLQASLAELQGEPKCETANVATVMKVDNALEIPAGTTALLKGDWKRVREVRREFGPPTVSKIPYLNRLFRNVGYGRETEEVVLMVTPRIVIQKEEEVKPPCVGVTAPAPVAMKRQVAPATHASPRPVPAPSQPVPHTLPLTPPLTQVPVPPLPPLVRVSEPPPPPAKALPPKADIVVNKKLVKILDKYEKACAEGRLDEAKVLATKALAIDPTCFRKER